jgi:hypothetical protein
MQIKNRTTQTNRFHIESTLNPVVGLKFSNDVDRLFFFLIE